MTHCGKLLRDFPGAPPSVIARQDRTDALNAELIRSLFGMKVRQACLEKGLSLSEFVPRCSRLAAYLTEAKKGRKYPKPDKIVEMAQGLGKSYNDLVPIRLAPPLTYLKSALASPLFHVLNSNGVLHG